MMYTRNKQAFKTKNVKVNTPSSVSSTSNRQTVSENGINLIEQLRHRMQNRNQKATGQHYQKERQNNQPSSQNKSSKISISKTYLRQPIKHQRNTQNMKNFEEYNKKGPNQDSKKWQVKQNPNKNVLDEQSDPHSNPFTKIKKNPFFQLVQKPQSLPPYGSKTTKQQHQRSSQLLVVQEYYRYTKQQQNNRSSLKSQKRQSQPQSIYLQQQRKKQTQDAQINELKQIYESPIQELQQESQEEFYQSHGRSQSQDHHERMGNQNQIKVSKWKDSKSHPQRSIQQSTHTPLTMPQVKPFLRRKSMLKIDSLNISLYVSPLGLSSSNRSANQSLALKAQNQYILLIESQICQLKGQLSNKIKENNLLSSQLNMIKQKSDRNQKQSTQLKQINLHLQRQVQEGKVKQFVKEKYDRLFSKMTNVLIITAMQLIQNKNFTLSLENSSLNCSREIREISEPSKTSHKNQIQYPAYTNKQTLSSQGYSALNELTENTAERIKSMSQCIARVQQTIQVSRKVMSWSFQQSKIQIPTENKGFTQLKFLNSQLQQAIIYKDKVIKRLKDQIHELKGLTSNVSNLQGKDQVENKDIQKGKLINQNPYSYVDQIHLLRHEINRLTQENCIFYQRYTQILQQITQKGNQKQYSKHQSKQQSVKRYPNESRVKQIASLIDNLDRHHLNGTQEIISSKVQYWVNSTDKTPQKARNPTAKRQQAAKSVQSVKKPKIKSDILLLQQPKHITPIYNPNQQVTITSNMTETYVSTKPHSSNKANIQTIVEYSKQEFSELIKQFKTTLSGLTPTKYAQPDEGTSNRQRKRQNMRKQYETIEPPTFRTPTHGEKTQFVQQYRQNQSQNPANQNINPYCSPYAEGVQNEQPHQQNPLQRISRLEYQKEFLSSERENLLKQIDELTQKLITMELQTKSQNLSLREQICKLKFQNQELVDQIVESQNIIMRQKQQDSTKNYQQALNFPKSNPSLYMESKQILQQALHQKQNQAQQLMTENIELHKMIQSLQAKQQLNKTTLKTSHQMINSDKIPSSSDPSKYTLAPSFEQLLHFLRKLPSQQKQYHIILLKLIEGYQKKISEMRQENVLIKTRFKDVEEYLKGAQSLFLKINKFMQSENSKIIQQEQYQKNYKKNRKKQIGIKKEIAAQTKKIIRKYQILNFGCLFDEFSSIKGHNLSSKSHQSMVSSYSSKINYHLMLLKSLIHGIGQQDLQLIQEQLGDYLKQLGKRIPTVLQRQEYEEQNMSSLDASRAQDDGDNDYS